MHFFFYRAVVLVTILVLLLLYGHIQRSNLILYGYQILSNSSDVLTQYHSVWNRSYSKSEHTRYLDVVPRRAYYDNRNVLGANRNVLLILAEVKDSSRGALVACEINGYQSFDISLIKESLEWVRRTYKTYTHAAVIIQCLGIPRHLIQNGSTTKVIYRNINDSNYTHVETEEPLVISTQDGWTVASEGSDSIVVCTALFGHPPRVNEWLKYQKAIGVDLVHLDVHPSFSENATSVYPYLQEALDSGFVRMEIWEDILENRIFYYGQVTKNIGCGFRYAGVFEYGIFCDYDEFFNPLIPKHKDVQFYVKKYFKDSRVGSVELSRKQFKCAAIEEVYKRLPDGNLTKSLSGVEAYHWLSQPKSIHRLRALESTQVHTAQLLVKGYIKRKVNKNEVYFGHIAIAETKNCLLGNGDKSQIKKNEKEVANYTSHTIS